jgi:hypothetical protein
MKIKVLTAYPNAIWGTHAAEWLSTAAALDVHGVHTLTEDPEAADAILFMEGHQGTDMFMEEVLWHPVRRRYPDKTFIYHDWDYAFPLMQGVYPSIRAVHHKPGVSAGGVYLARIEENHAVSRARQLDLPQDLLYSFVGANNCEVRDRILKADVPETYVADTTQRHAWLLSPEERATYEGEYASVCVRSRFMLSPRGIGPNTYRLFEAMEMGRCPVILSDDWVPPPFIPWEKFSVDDLKGALFPMRLGPADLRQDTEDFYVGHTIGAALQSLLVQVRLELRHAERETPPSAEVLEQRASGLLRDFASPCRPSAACWTPTCWPPGRATRRRAASTRCCCAIPACTP